MSNPSEPTPQPKSPAKNIFRIIKGIVTSPYGVAAIASLSFHAVLFAAIPRFSSASFAAFTEEEGPNEPRTVPLVTLSSAEQGRLPNFNRPQPSTAIANITPNTPPRPSINALPNASTFNRSSSIFNRSNNRLSTPSFTPPSQLRRNNIFRNPYTTNSPSLSIRNTPSRSDRSSNDRTTVIPDNIPQPPAGFFGTDSTNDDTLARQLELERQLAEEQAANAEGIPEPPNQEPAEGLPELPDESELPPDGTENTEELAANLEPTDEPSRLERLMAKFQYDAVNTSDDEVAANYEAWQAQQPEDDNELPVETAETGELLLETDFGLCTQTPPNNGEIGVLVAPNGTPSAPTVLRSTGYDHLNQAALETLMSSDFPETEGPVRYPFEIVVNYDSETCTNPEEILETVRNSEETDTAE
ncbi:MAG: hypothetical protein KTR27_08670 [Leptolyngbyaceae cyanobacterium MAG.088]|nr:hypothetical protein [Leptolyngbyaceae cyanobacterium MAG.088]